MLPQLTEAAVKAALQEDAEGLLAEVALDSSKSKVRGTPRRRRVVPSPPEPGVSAARIPGVDDVPPGGGEVQLAGDRVNVRRRALRLFSHAPLTHHAPRTLRRSVLEEVGISRRAGYLIGIVNRERDTIRELLLKTTFHFQKVLDVQWRVDHSVRTKYQDQIGEPSFLISIITAGGEGAPDGQRQEVKFACSKEELQDLVAKLKDACTQVDRILGTSRK